MEAEVQDFSVRKHTSTTTVTIILDTEVSTSDRDYAYTGSTLYNTHVSTTVAGPDSEKSRVKSRVRRDLQRINDRVLDDRGDSTEDIVPKGDVKLGNMAH
ncbi:hypothetical protein Asppvi_002124 [Aspergillus pseudoviridinutans]|uniref:Uncharacterized protein n=1 Tax=Aspergillus pseudoviridinutans TaxID=1517512 RepID=A0A9P3ES39_9EURO|nr:uncharacterized protein Asppvi_002124 [Aspergillus pseudoviridinutans]GIJ83305.1 hypothetical protein Asppvi_002124 [Aspergillus pseudoviridinutans]